MIGFLKNLLGPGSALNIKEMMAKGAIIVDVRTEREFRMGHVKGSINIPLDKLPHNTSKLKKDKPVVTCCASGARSSVAKRILINAGFTEVHNAGSWNHLMRMLQ